MKYVALCVLLAATCTLAYVPLGSANLPISLVIAALKAGLVGAVFMHLSNTNTINRLAAIAGPMWVVVMLLLIGTDYATR